MREDHEETLSLSLVDGITCGLAATLLLLIVFGVNMAASTASLGGIRGHGTTSSRLGNMTGEPVDIVVEIDGPTNAVGTNSGWQHKEGGQNRIDDSESVDPANARTVYIREIKAGFDIARIVGADAPPQDIKFDLYWDPKVPPPKGWVHLFRSGEEFRLEIRCKSPASRYEIIRRFDLRHGLVDSQCH